MATDGATTTMIGETTMTDILDIRDQALAMTYIEARRKLGDDCHSRLEMARDLLVDGAVTVNEDGTAQVKGHDQPEYSVSVKTCTCTDFTSQKAPKGLCKHILALVLYHRTDQRLEQMAAPVAQQDVPEHPRVRPEFIVMIQGKQFVQFAGLLALAHDSGLHALDAQFIAVTPGLATARATATFDDGRTFTECGDATPDNVRKNIAPHFARMALTRAKARCLRDALNIGMVAVEELTDFQDADPVHIGRSQTKPPFRPQVDGGMWREQ